MQAHLTIGRIARGAGTGVETIRFYEREGPIAKPGRRQTGWPVERQSSPADRPRWLSLYRTVMCASARL